VLLRRGAWGKMVLLFSHDRWNKDFCREDLYNKEGKGGSTCGAALHYRLR